MIQLYQAEWCPFSHRVRQLLTERGVPFVALPVEPEPEQRDAMAEAVGERSIPVAVLDDGTVLAGDTDEIVAELERRHPETADSAAHHARRLEARAFE
jgi:glutathione S-transferase